jgi:hypothetical protein
LSKIVAHPKALSTWRSGATLQYSLMLTDTPGEVFNRSVIDSHVNLRTAREYSTQVKKVESNILEIILDVSSIAEDLHLVMSKKARRKS